MKGKYCQILDSYKDSVCSFRLELLFHCYIPFWITLINTFIAAPRSTPSFSWLQCSNLGDACDKWYEYIDQLVQLRHSVVYVTSYTCLQTLLPGFLMFTSTIVVKLHLTIFIATYGQQTY
jgi:hypothetical protein